MSDHNSQEKTTDFNFAPAELSQMYLKLSENNINDFESANKNEKLAIIIDNLFNAKMKSIDAGVLLKDVDILNKSFIMFYKSTINNFKMYEIFIFYCDYFNLDYHLVYKKLHIKLKNKIEDDLILLLGGFRKYAKIKKKLGVNNHTTLFDLLS